MPPCSCSFRGLNYIESVHVRDRFKHVADEVIMRDYDIIALQEVRFC